MIELVASNLAIPGLPEDRFVAFVSTSSPNGPEEIRFAEVADYDRHQGFLPSLASVRVTDVGYSVRDYLGSEVKEARTPEEVTSAVCETIRARLPHSRQAKLDRLDADERRAAYTESLRKRIHKWAARV